MKSKCIITTFLVLVSITSCVSLKKLTYLKTTDEFYNTDTSAKDARTFVTPLAYKLMPYDNLYIRVITPDPQWSAIFNTSPGGTTGGLTAESVVLSSYPVDDKGCIEIPYVGKVEVAEKTLSQIKAELDLIFKKYVTDAYISVQLVNNYVSLLGEVKMPGRYPITKDQLNIFEALSMAGDMTDYSNLRKIKLIRQSPYGPIVKEFSLSDRSIFTSDYYYIMPNDIIYAAPMHGKAFLANSSVWSVLLTTLTSALGVIAFMRTF
jgi:polysaccharide export outer membrane protein